MRGLTLIEVLVALAILGVVGGALLETTGSSIHLRLQAYALRAALSAAESAVEELLVGPAESIAEGRTTWTTHDGISVVRIIQPGPIDRLMTIEVEAGSAHGRPVRLQTFRSREWRSRP